MRYQYKSEVRALDFWALSMSRTYHSIVGVCNIVFGTAMILLTVRFWEQAGNVTQALLFFACLLIPVIQPLGIFLKSKAQVMLIAQGAELVFADDGLHVSYNGQNQHIRWDKIKGVKKQAGMVIIYTDINHGYMLTSRVLGKDREEFYNYAAARIKPVPDSKNKQK